MLSKDEYKISPCRISAIPYWKMRTFKIPNNISVIHDEDYIACSDNSYKDTQYFRLKHNLQSIASFSLNKLFMHRNVDVNSINDLQEIVSMINKCYIDIQVLPEYRKRKLGQAVVNKLLGNLIGKADFVTVSGEVDNKINP